MPEDLHYSLSVHLLLYFPWGSINKVLAVNLLKLNLLTNVTKSFEMLSVLQFVRLIFVTLSTFLEEKSKVNFPYSFQISACLD